MGLLSFLKSDDTAIIVKEAASKGPGKLPMSITVGDIRKGRVVDSNGYVNEVVLFVRANKSDRKSRE
jgi:hypothetical protein